VGTFIPGLHVKKKRLFYWTGLFSANQTFLKAFQIALIGWKKSGPSKKPHLLWTCKPGINFLRLHYTIEFLAYDGMNCIKE